MFVPLLTTRIHQNQAVMTQIDLISPDWLSTTAERVVGLAKAEIARCT